jgi:hypothetical protein
MDMKLREIVESGRACVLLQGTRTATAMNKTSIERNARFIESSFGMIEIHTRLRPVGASNRHTSGKALADVRSRYYRIAI